MRFTFEEIMNIATEAARIAKEDEKIFHYSFVAGRE